METKQELKALLSTRDAPLIAASTSCVPDPFLAIIEKVSLASDGDIAKLEKLLEMKKNWDKDQARKSFLGAFSAFQQEMPPVVSAKAGFNWKYAALCDITSTANEYLGRHGLSYRFEQKESEGKMRIDCIISHVAGHSVTTSMEAALVQTPKNQSGGTSMNNLQQIGATVSYLRRYTLTSALGITTADQDSDGRLDAQGGDLINDKQLEELEKLIKPFSSQRERFLKWVNVTEMRDLPLSRFAKAKHFLENKVQENGNT